MVFTQAQKTDISEITKSVLCDVDFLKIIADKVSELVMIRIEDKMNQLLTKCDNMEKTIKNYETDNEILRNKLDDLEQYTRRNSLRIWGIKEERNENVENQVLNVCNNQLGLTLSNNDIDRCHRIGMQGNKTRPIIVKFIGYRQRAMVFSAKKKLKGTGVQIREDLTKNRATLLHCASERFGFKNTWTYDGIVIVNKDNRKVRLKNLKDLENMNLI
ncbi:hypothetical protein RN001_013379 [Aquatica leii]|uniref:Zinc finger DNA binding protein n=1 Tax=Aquatica leii TaxID=1421715 RepID=A0AAN7SDV1_9COLE|nr:hypothetical protein RN001_013379 [Aquatica leii]